jgi:hypothetical protein
VLTERVGKGDLYGLLAMNNFGNKTASIIIAEQWWLVINYSL